jgi:hypothetical protein
VPHKILLQIIPFEIVPSCINTTIPMMSPFFWALNQWSFVFHDKLSGWRVPLAWE